jgi:hypothetical protein
MGNIGNMISYMNINGNPMTPQGNYVDFNGNQSFGQ